MVMATGTVKWFSDFEAAQGDKGPQATKVALSSGS